MPSVNLESLRNFESNAVANRRSVLFLKKSELKRIRDDLYWTQIDAEEVEKEKAKKEKIREKSRALAEEWPNPLKIAEERKLELRKEAEEAEEKQYLEILKQKEQERKNYLTECRRKLRFDTDSIRTFNRGLLLSEVLRERDAQVKFNKQVTGDDIQEETALASKIKEDVQLWQQQKYEEIKKKICKRRNYKCELKDQMEEHALRREEEKIGEKEELEAIKRDVQIAEAKYQEQVLNKKKETRKFFEDALEQDKKIKEKLRMDEEDEEKLMEIYATVRQKMAKIGRERQNSLKEGIIQRRIWLSEIVATSQASSLAAETECLNRAIAEKESREKETREKEAAYRKKLVEEIKAARKDQLERELKDKMEAEEMRKWNLIQRYKQDEMNKKAAEEERKNHKQKCLAVRKTYDEQVVELKNIVEKQKQEELENLIKIKEKWDAEDKTFLKYSGAVIAESQSKGRNLIPMQKVIKTYKKKNHLVSIHRDDPLQRSRVPFGPRYTFIPELKVFEKEESGV